MNNIWSKYSSDYDKLNALPAYSELLYEYIKIINKHVNNKRTILEIGMGTGNLTKLLSEKYPDSKIIAFDSDLGMLNKAKEKGYNNNVEIVHAEASSFLKKQINKYDIIIMNNVMYTLDNKTEALKSIRKSLNSEGFFIFSDPVPPKDYKYFSILLNKSFSISKMVSLIKSIPTLLRILMVNLKIDKKYKRLNRAEYEKIIKIVKFKIIYIGRTYAGQANMFVLKK